MLTDAKVRALKPKSATYRVGDSGGLCIEVRPTGSKFWRYRFRFDGKPSMATFGEYPALKLSEARIARDRAKAQVRLGVSPVLAAQAEKNVATERAASTFAAVASDWLAIRATKISQGSLKREQRLIEKDLGPYLGRMPVADISRKALLDALRRIEQRGAIETAHRALALAGMVFKYAIRAGLAERNPAMDMRVDLQSCAVKHFASITDPSGVAALMRAIYGYRGTPTVVAALKLAPLFFVRPGELRMARWSDFDLDAAEWRFTASKTNPLHLVPLAKQAVVLLRELKVLNGRSEYVFPGARSSKRPMSENAVNAALRILGFDGDTMTGHGFRALARTLLDEVMQFRPDIVEHQLAHTVRDPLGRAYNRTTHLPERRRMMQAWADYLDELRIGAK